MWPAGGLTSPSTHKERHTARPRARPPWRRQGFVVQCGGMERRGAAPTVSERAEEVEVLQPALKLPLWLIESPPTLITTSPALLLPLLLPVAARDECAALEVPSTMAPSPSPMAEAGARTLADAIPPACCCCISRHGA